MKRWCTLVAITMSSRLRPFSHEPIYLSVRPWVSVAHPSVISMHVVTLYVLISLVHRTKLLKLWQASTLSDKLSLC